MTISKLIVITGVSQGLGRAMTNGFIAAGQSVAGCARSNDAIQSLNREYGPPNRFEVVDVATPSQVEHWAHAVIEDLGAPDVLINCAAMINRNAPLWETSTEEFSQLVDVNLKGVHHIIRHFVPAMVQRGSGVIVNFSSYWGRSTSAEVAAYCATKFGVEGLSRGLADDLPSGMASVALNPGVIHTEMLESCFAEGARAYPNPEQWADSAVPYILGLGAAENGESVTVPGF